MIIKTMEQWGKCIDNKVELEWRPMDTWGDAKFDFTTLERVQKLIKEGRLRTKPLTAAIWIYTNVAGEAVESKIVSPAPSNQDALTRKTYTIPLDGE